ncbi:hypothetical protein [Tenacibaculum mesophilum]|uniref:hypothetical protein n=1 Tax=Tenacibaculum mesophilum TaxID=104268 RepID=UPI000F629539|nr:hypothetical protein [Tenacibaculum mesophilum]QFS27474.1 hypothetical protein F9Y86_03280 [Tenacibaculum mesophilum]
MLRIRDLFLYKSSYDVAAVAFHKKVCAVVLTEYAVISATRAVVSTEHAVILATRATFNDS